MVNYVKFLRGTPEAFEKLAAKDSNTLYFISEKDATVGSLYLGSKLISASSSSITGEISIADLKDVLIDNDLLGDGSILMYDYESKKWVNKTVDDIVVDVMRGATSTKAGKSGLVPAPQAGEENKFLKGDGTWAEISEITSDERLQIANLVTTVGSLIGDKQLGDASISTIQTIAVKALTEVLVPEDAKESLDTLQEIAAWIQSHPDDASAMNDSITKLQTNVGNINDVLYDSTDEHGQVVPGLITKVENLYKEGDTSQYVLKTTYLTEVGDINLLANRVSNNSTLVDEINAINERLTWSEIE